MNRHRQEREREQVLQARQLLMLQEFPSTLMMSGQNSQSAPAKLGLRRSASEGPLKDGICNMGVSPVAGSVGRNFLHSNPFNPSGSPSPSLNWNLGSGLDSAHSSNILDFNLDGLMPSYQTRQTYSAPMSSSSSQFLMQQQPALNRALSQHDMMGSTPFDKSMQLSMFSFDSNSPTLQRVGSFQSQPNLSQEGSILTGSPVDETTNFMSPTNRSFLQQRSNEYSKRQELPQVMSLQSEASINMVAVSNGFQFIPCPGAEVGARPSLPISQSMDFCLGSANHLDGGLSWMHKATPSSLDALSTPSKDCQQELKNAEPKMDDKSMGDASSEPKGTKWDLGLTDPNPDDPNIVDNKVRELAPIAEGALTLPFEASFSHTTGNDLDGQPKLDR